MPTDMTPRQMAKARRAELQGVLRPRPPAAPTIVSNYGPPPAPEVVTLPDPAPNLLGPTFFATWLVLLAICLAFGAASTAVLWAVLA